MASKIRCGLSTRARNSCFERLFFALWPDAATEAALSALVQQLADAGGRGVRVANLHSTLVFLGDVPTVRRACVEQVGDAVRAGQFDLSLNRIRSRARGGVIWIEPSIVPAPLGALVNMLTTSLEHCGYRPEARPYRAHVTLVRGARRRMVLPSPTPIAWSVREFCLVRSVLSADGARYEIQRRWPLIDNF